MLKLQTILQFLFYKNVDMVIKWLLRYKKIMLIMGSD